MYESSPWLSRQSLSLDNARLSNCRTLSLVKPNTLPISDNVFSLPSSIPNLSLSMLFSLGLNIFRRLCTCLLISCFETHTSGISIAESAVISCNRNKIGINLEHSYYYVAQERKRAYSDHTQPSKIRRPA